LLRAGEVSHAQIKRDPAVVAAEYEEKKKEEKEKRRKSFVMPSSLSAPSIVSLLVVGLKQKGNRR